MNYLIKRHVKENINERFLIGVVNFFVAPFFLIILK